MLWPVWASYLVTVTVSLRADQLYPFGEVAGDNRLPIGDDECSPDVPLQTPIAFYDYRYWSLFINTNGALSFEHPESEYSNVKSFPVGAKVIAPYLADADTTLSGNVFYRETSDASLLEKATVTIQDNFATMFQFQATNMFIVTWHNVGYYSQQNDKINTFQVVIASDGFDSFCFFLYQDLQWTIGQRKVVHNESQHAHAGFDSADHVRFTTLRFSGSSDVYKIASDSNLGASDIEHNGLWLYHIGLIDTEIGQPKSSDYARDNTVNQGRIPEGNRPIDVDRDPHHGSGDISTPDISRVPPDDSRMTGTQKEPTSCYDGGSRRCHTNGECVDHSGGYCCICMSPTWGNGVHCNQPVSAQRVTGKVSGTVNNERIEQQDLHAYVVLKDGRSYTAISRLPKPIGFAMQAAYPIATSIGWLFAGNKAGGKNGAQITGGSMNRTATLRFSPGGETLVVSQTFTNEGHHGFLSISTTLNGALPEISMDDTVKLDDFSEEFVIEAPGLLRSSAEHTYSMSGLSWGFRLDQTLRYEEPCGGRDPPAHHKLLVGMRLTVNHKRAYIVYGEEEQIVRYAITSQLERDEASACAAAGCAPQATCGVEDGAALCTCRPGFEGDGGACQDVDECRRGAHRCDVMAQCVNEEGSYSCTCPPGTKGDGFTCKRVITCADVSCHRYAQCVIVHGQPTCKCSPGFQGDGTFNCQAVEIECDEVNNCDANADCVYNYDMALHQCQCRDGFTGDGFTCFQADGGGAGCEILNNCDVNARCTPTHDRYVCVCDQGYVGDGYRCEAEGHVIPGPRDCEVRLDCGEHASCILNNDQRICQCDPGYKGDGYFCQEENCNINNFCDINAQCVFESYSQRYSCRCNAGFEGDGQFCRQQGDCRVEPTLCDTYARCMQRGAVYVCTCIHGYRGDGRHCSPEENVVATSLLITQGTSILDLPFTITEDKPGRRLVHDDGQTAIGIDADCSLQIFYWTDVKRKTINRAALQGDNVETIVTGVGSPEGLAVDWLTQNIYWTDSELDRIEVSRTDGSHRTTLIDTHLTNPRALELDIQRGIMFWTDWNREAPKIESAFMDGTNRQTIVSDDVGLPNGLALDRAAEQICWADAGTRKVECVSYSGHNRRALYEQASYPFSLTFANDMFYWTDWDMNVITSISKHGGQPADELEAPGGGNGRLFGITAVAETCPQSSNACARDNGGCRYLCLPTPNGGRTCPCPGDVPETECTEIGLLL